MTVPSERTSSVLRTRDFLFKILLPPSQGGFPRTPKEVKKQARSLLKHYPSAFEMEDVAGIAPAIFGEVTK